MSWSGRSVRRNLIEIKQSTRELGHLNKVLYPTPVQVSPQNNMHNDPDTPIHDELPATLSSFAAARTLPSSSNKVSRPGSSS